jgi:hypothetical protein
MFTCKVVSHNIAIKVHVSASNTEELSFKVLSLSERFAVHETGYEPGRIGHHGVSVAAEIRNQYLNPVNTLIVIFYSLSSGN